MRGRESKNHNLITYECNKTSASCFDDIWYILNDEINTLPYGHKNIPKQSIIFFFFEYMRNLKMINTEDVKYPPTSIDDIKDKKLKAHLKIVPTLIDKVKDKKLANLKNQSENLVTIKSIN